jgi:hypothetical protein
MLRNNLELEPDPEPKLTVKSDPDPKEKLRIHNTAPNIISIVTLVKGTYFPWSADWSDSGAIFPLLSLLTFYVLG